MGEAYNTLSDKEKKAEFDRWGPPEEENQADGQQQQSRGGFGRRRGGRSGFYEHEIDPNDIFNAFFGGGFPRGNVARTGGKYSKRRRSNVAVIIVRIVIISSFFL